MIISSAWTTLSGFQNAAILFFHSPVESTLGQSGRPSTSFVSFSLHRTEQQWMVWMQSQLRESYQLPIGQSLILLHPFQTCTTHASYDETSEVPETPIVSMVRMGLANLTKRAKKKSYLAPKGTAILNIEKESGKVVSQSLLAPGSWQWSGAEKACP